MAKTIEILQGGAVVNTIIADEDFAEAMHPGAWRVAAIQPEPPMPDVMPRHITVGAFFDRFGAAKWAILADTAPTVAAVVKDSSIRKYIDLDNPDLPAGIALIQQAGHDIDPSAIIAAPVQDSERP